MRYTVEVIATLHAGPGRRYTEDVLHSTHEVEAADPSAASRMVRLLPGVPPGVRLQVIKAAAVCVNKDRHRDDLGRPRAA